jgi:hypothetical protein
LLALMVGIGYLWYLRRRRLALARRS